MIEEGLKVKFVGEDQSLGKTSADAAKSLDNVAKASTQATTALRTQATVAQQASQAAEKMAKSADVAGGSLEKVASKSYTVRQAAQNMSNVIRDIPFGINNPAIFATSLDHVVGSFGMLKEEMGGSKAAFASLAGSLAGTGGLLIGFNLLSLAATYLIPKLFSSSEAADQNTESLALLGRELQSVKADMDSFGESLDYANKIGKLRVDIDFGKGLKADLIDLQGQSIGNLTLTSQLEKESARVESIASKIRETLINQISETGSDADKLFSALDKGILDSVSDLPENIKKTYTKLQEAEKQQLDVSKQVIKARQDQNIIYAQIAQKKLDIDEDARKKTEESAKKAAQESEKQRREELQRLKEYQQERSQIVSEFSKDFGQIKIFTLPDVGDPKSNTELFDRLRKRLGEESLRQLPVKIKLPVDIDISTDFKTGKIDITEKLKDVQGVNPLKVPIPLKPTIEWKPTDFQKKYEDFIKQVNAIIANAETGVVVNVGQGIADAISGQGLENAFKNIAGIMGDFLQELGKLLIKESIQVEAFKKAFASLISNPVAGIAVGVGLVALGGLIKNTVLPKPKGFAEGGLAFGPTLGLIGEGAGTNRSNPEVIAPLNDLKNFIGTENGFPQYLPAFEMSHDKFRLWYERANRYGKTFGK